LFARAYTNDAEKAAFITHSLGSMPGADDNEKFINFLISEPTNVVKTIISYELSKDPAKKAAAKAKIKEIKDVNGNGLNMAAYGADAGTVDNPSDQAIAEVLAEEAFGQGHSYSAQETPTPRRDIPTLTPPK